jgi:hypothetical protein
MHAEEKLTNKKQKKNPNQTTVMEYKPKTKKHNPQ